MELQSTREIRKIVRAAPRAAVFSLLWYALNGNDPAAWAAGVPVIAAATAASMLLQPAGPFGLNWRKLAAFAPFFVWKSLAGGFDVSRRALHPRLPLAPLLVPYTLHLPPGSSRVFMANTISLMPGTLSAELQGDRLSVHALDGSEESVTRDLRSLEARVAGIFGLRLPFAVEPERIG
jgi:multicomponent Na+:H+ antiporter subunit E